MKYLVSLVIVAGCATPSAQPPTALLEGLKGQTCRGTIEIENAADLAYTIDQKDGKWMVHDVFRVHGQDAIRDAGWLPATANGSTLTFTGVSVAPITLTATGPHTVTAEITAKRTLRSGTATLDCKQGADILPT